MFWFMLLKNAFEVSFLRCWFNREPFIFMIFILLFFAFWAFLILKVSFLQSLLYTYNNSMEKVVTNVVLYTSAILIYGEIQSCIKLSCRSLFTFQVKYGAYDPFVSILLLFCLFIVIQEIYLVYGKKFQLMLAYVNMCTEAYNLHAVNLTRNFLCFI